MSSNETAPIDKVAIIGTGFIGLPLALMLAANGKRVVGVDIDENLVEAINDASLNFDEQELESLLQDETVQENLVAQTEPTDGDAYVISVPTPLTEPSRSPNLSAVESAVESIIPHLEPGELINIESTIPPLTCEETIGPMLADAGFKPGDDIQLAHSPERILPGDVFQEIVHNDRIIGGIDEQSAQRASRIYEPFLQGNVYYTDLVTAEMCKLLENTFRDVNVALANEFALIGESLGVEVSDVIRLANQHPRVDILNPGIGVGGHCLPVDPWFLNEVDPENANLVTTARRVNDRMPVIAARKVRRGVAHLTAPRILALGAAYKPDTYDIRNSPALEIIEELRLDGYDIAHYDRHVEGLQYSSLESLVEEVDPDVVLQLVPHDETVSAIDSLRDRLREEDIDVLQFGVGDQLSLL